MLNSISLAARNLRILLTCLWIYLPGTTPANLRYVCCSFLKKKSTFWTPCCGLIFRLAWVNTEHRTIVTVVSSCLWVVNLEFHRNFPTVAVKQLVLSITQGLALDMYCTSESEIVPTGCKPMLCLCLQRIWDRTATHIFKDASQTESKAGPNPQATVGPSRHLVRELPAAQMKWKWIGGEREGDEMVHLEHLRGLKQPKAVQPSASALRLIHPSV